MKTISLKSLVLDSGSHESAEKGMCVMEAVSYFAKEKHSAAPSCACPVLTSFMVQLNDHMNKEDRQILKPYIKKLIGTRDGNSQKRLEILVRASVAEITPYAFRLTGIESLIASAEKLEAFKDTGSFKDMESAARSAESAAWSAAWSAARSAESAAWSAESARMKVWKMTLKALDRALKV